MSNEIAVLENTEIQLAFTSPNGIDILLEKVRKEAASEVPDLTTKKGRDRIASLAYKVSKTKTLVDDFGKELVSEEKKRLALIDADRKKWRDECDKLRDEIRKPLTDWEQAESDRVQRHRDAIQQLRGLAPQAIGANSETIIGLIAQAESVLLGEHWQEFSAEAGKAKDETLAVLRLDLQRRQQYESEQAELARLREEAARREQEDRDRRIAEEAAAKARADAEAEARAERDAIEAKARAEREAAERARIASEQAEARAKAEAEAAKLREQESERRRIESEERAKRDAQEAAERAERNRIAAIEAERARIEQERIESDRKSAAEQAAREADKENKRKVNNAILSALESIGVATEQAKVVIAAIAKGSIPNVSIRY